MKEKKRVLTATFIAAVHFDVALRTVGTCEQFAVFCRQVGGDILTVGPRGTGAVLTPVYVRLTVES